MWRQDEDAATQLGPSVEKVQFKHPSVVPLGPDTHDGRLNWFENMWDRFAPMMRDRLIRNFKNSEWKGYFECMGSSVMLLNQIAHGIWKKTGDTIDGPSCHAVTEKKACATGVVVNNWRSTCSEAHFPRP